MDPLLLVVGSASELRRMAPLARAAVAARVPARLVALGPALDPARTPASGLPRPDVHLPGGDPATALAQATAELAAHPPAVVVTCGHGPAARAFAIAAPHAGVPSARLDAGRRGGDPAGDRWLRVGDAAAELWFVAGTEQALQLQREGAPMARIHVVGSTLSAPRHGTATRRGVRILLERPDDALAAALAEVARAAGEAIAAEPADDPAAIAGARAVVTDRDDVQELAARLGIRCVTTATSTRLPETVDAGTNQVAGREPAAAARALGIALADVSPPTPQRAPAAATDGNDRDDGAGAAIVAALRSFADAAERAGAEAATPAEAKDAARADATAVALPSDGDRSGRTLGAEECELAVRAIRSGTLNSTKGTFVTRFEREFAQRVGRKHAIACSSGSAAVHCAIAALRLAPGDEVVTTPITDMGALTCISYEGGVPVFADVDPTTFVVTAATIAAQRTERTRAVIVTHLFGRPCDMGPIVAFAREHDLPLIEDCAQAFGAEERGGPVGSFGAFACYSLQQGKHMTTGEGGVVATDDDQLARAVFLFVNKAWGYGDPEPDHYFPALNARMTELQGAVALAQLQKLDWVVQRRREVAAQLGALLQDVDGLRLPQDPPGGRHSWWKYPLLVDPARIAGGAAGLGRRMKARGVFCVPRYVQKPAFECRLYQDFDAHPVTRLPLEHNPRRHQAQPLFHRRDYPGAVQALDEVVVLPINELYDRDHVAFVARVIREEAAALLQDALR